MKNICITLLLAIALISFFSFTNNKAVFLQEDDSYEQSDKVFADTVPSKKDTAVRKSGKTPYDSFGKPKKMDTTKLQGKRF